MNDQPLAPIRPSPRTTPKTRLGAAACAAALLAFGAYAAQSAQPAADDAPAQDAPIAFVGATLLPGTGAGPIENAVLLVRAGRIEAVGPASEIPIPDGAERVDLQGSYVIPGLINAHGHVGISMGMQQGAAANTQQNVLDQLRLYARYGVTTVLSLDDPGTQTIPQRDAQNTPDLDRARVYTSGPVVSGNSVTAVRNAVAARAEQGVDWAKIRVDPVLGFSMPPEIYGAIIEAAHAHDLRLAAHMVNLEDAKELLRRGADLLAHSVRDRPVDDELIELMLARDICLIPTFTRELSTFVYAERPSFFDDPFFAEEADPQVVETLQEPQRQNQMRNSATAAFFRDALPLAEANMMALHEAGVRIALGTDSGLPGRFQGYFEYLELVTMQEAGMSPAGVLHAATGQAAACLELDDVGTLEAGKWADFVILEEDPLEDVRALRTIVEVRVAGNPVL